MADLTTISVFTSVPTYDEIVQSSSDEDLNEDTEQLVKQDQFERAYNFRFEEPNKDYVCISIPFLI